MTEEKLPKYIVYFFLIHAFHKLLLNIFYAVQSVLASVPRCVQGMVSELYRADNPKADMRPVHTINSNTKHSVLSTK